MAAKDYKICCALFNAYIAKVSKRNSNQMLEDRRPISEGEIMMLIDWFLDNEIGEDESKSLSFKSCLRDGKRVQLTFIDDDKTEEPTTTETTKEDGKDNTEH